MEEFESPFEVSTARIQLPPIYLADTSALTQMAHPPVYNALAPLISQGLVARCGPVDLEMLRTARHHQELVRQRNERSLAFPLQPIGQEHFDRAADVMALLAAANLHRAAKFPDLLIAAVSEHANLVLIHYDQDYDHIASVTGQKTQWVVPRGSLP